MCEDAGVPAVVVSTKAFASMGRHTARALGRPGLPILAGPHPFDCLSEGEVDQAAESLTNEVVSALTGSAEHIDLQYRDSWLQPPENLPIACDLIGAHSASI